MHCHSQRCQDHGRTRPRNWGLRPPDRFISQECLTLADTVLESEHGLRNTVEERVGLIDSLQSSEMPDDAWDEEEALDWLNTHATTDDVHFVLCDGDLLLVDSEFEV